MSWVEVEGVAVQLRSGQHGDPSRLTRAQVERRAEWIRQQRLSDAEAVYIPIDYDPSKPYPPEPSGQR